jgi:glutamyl-tRNA synthetase
MDMKKLENLNGHYIREAADEWLADLVAPKMRLDEDQKQLLIRAMPEVKARAHDLNQLADGAHFLFAARPLGLDAAAAGLLTPDARSLLRSIHDTLSRLAEWDTASVEAAIREVADANGLKLGKVAQPLRAALTGRTTSPGIFDVLALLGREDSLARIADQMLEPSE